MVRVASASLTSSQVTYIQATIELASRHGLTWFMLVLCSLYVLVLLMRVCLFLSCVCDFYHVDKVDSTEESVSDSEVSNEGIITTLLEKPFFPFSRLTRLSVLRELKY